MFLELEVKREVTDYIYMNISYRTAGYCDELRSASNVFYVAEPKVMSQPEPAMMLRSMLHVQTESKQKE